jgi:hypothetical protein
LSPPVHTADALRSMNASFLFSFLCAVTLMLEIRFWLIEEGYIGRSKMSRSRFTGP